MHRTDHALLTWLLNFKNLEGQVVLWIRELQEYKIMHLRGQLNGNADALSRGETQSADNNKILKRAT